MACGHDYAGEAIMVEEAQRSLGIVSNFLGRLCVEKIARGRRWNGHRG
jgi:hypothetical protein